MAKLSNRERQRERSQQIRMQTLIERKHKRRIAMIISAASKDMLKTYEASGAVGTVDVLPYAVYQALTALWRDSIGIASKRMLTKLKSRHSNLTLKFDIFGGDFGADDDADSPAFSAVLQDYIDQHGGQKIAADISTQTREQIVEMVSVGSSEYDSTRDIARSILERVPDIAKYRAERIARTEVHGATNYAHDQVARSLNLPMKKEWIAASQARTRDSHREADSRDPIPLDDLFVVGNAKLRYAGDSRGPAEEVINCRCAIGYVVAD